MRWAFAVCLVGCSAAAGPNVALDKAQKQYADLNFAEANRSIAEALKQPNNDRETLLKILELQAVVLGTLGQNDKSAAAFQQLLSLDPAFALSGNHPPRVTTAFFEARAWAANNGSLEARQLDGVRVEVTKDPAKQVKKVRFFIGGAATVSALVGNTASAPKQTTEVSWWAQLLGDKDAILSDLGSPTSLKTEAAPAGTTPPVPAPAPIVAELRKVPERLEPPPMPPLVAAPAPSPTPVGRYVGVGLLAAGVASGGVAITFGVLANGTKAQVDGATANGFGQITGLSQKRAFELDAQQRQQATISNAFSIAGAALGVAGGALLVLSLASNDSVAIVPNGLGLGLAGTLP